VGGQQKHVIRENSSADLMADRHIDEEHYIKLLLLRKITVDNVKNSNSDEQNRVKEGRWMVGC